MALTKLELEVLHWIVKEAAERFSSDRCEDVPKEVSKLITDQDRYSIGQRAYELYVVDKNGIEIAADQSSTLARYLAARVKEEIEK